VQKHHLILYLFSLLIFISNYCNAQEVDKIQHLNDLNNILPHNQSEAVLIRKLTIDDYLISYIDSGNLQFVSYLLIKKADPNYCNESEITPLMAAAMNSDTNITKLLIRKGAFVNYMNYKGERALQWSVIARQVEQLRILIENKADVNLKDENGISPIFYALGYSKYDLMNYANIDYISFLQPDTSISTTYNLLHLLTKAGADINLENELDCTPLLFATFQRDTSLIRILCALGANPNKTTQAGVTPLIYAIQEGSYGVAETLIKHGADVSYRLPDDSNALFNSVRSNNDSIAELLLQNKAMVNEKNSLGLTPLHYAAGFGYPFMVNLLIGYGANVNETDIYGNTPLIAAIYSGALQVTDILIDSGVDVNKPDNKGNTPLMIAAQFNDTLLIGKLSHAGADLNSINNINLNALSIAIENSSAEAFIKLIALGANTKNPSSGKSYYQHSIEIGCIEISSFLAGKGLQTRLKPNIGSINLYAGFSTNQNNFMYDFGSGVYEPISKLLINIGYKYQPFSNRVLVYKNSSYYQFWEKRNSIYLSIQYLLTLNKSYLRGHVGFIPGLSNELSWNKRRGLESNSGAKWFLAPSIGLFYQRRSFTVIGKWEFANYSQQINGANRFNLQLMRSIPLAKRYVNKKIKWLD